MHVGDESGELRRRTASRFAEQRRRQQPRGFFERFDPGNQRRRSRLFGAAADEGEAPEPKPPSAANPEDKAPKPVSKV